jgi:hypothetical protein
MATYDLLGVYYSLSRTFIPLKESFTAQKLAAEPFGFPSSVNLAPRSFAEVQPNSRGL